METLPYQFDDSSLSAPAKGFVSHGDTFVISDDEKGNEDDELSPTVVPSFYTPSESYVVTNLEALEGDTSEQPALPSGEVAAPAGDQFASDAKTGTTEDLEDSQVPWTQTPEHLKGDKEIFQDSVMGTAGCAEEVDQPMVSLDSLDDKKEEEPAHQAVECAVGTACEKGEAETPSLASLVENGMDLANVQAFISVCQNKFS